MEVKNIELLNIDCLDYLLSCETEKFDLLLQYPPFGVTQNEWDVKPNLEVMWREWMRVSKENAAIIFFATQPFASELILSNQKYFRYDLIWYKALGSGFLNAPKMPMRNHEHILVFYRKLPTYNPQMSVGGKRKTGKRLQNTNGDNYGKFTLKDEDRVYDNNGINYPQSVIDISNGDRTKESDHPTQKPLDLIRYLVKTYSNEGDMVFDGYFGSGTTPVAYAIENREGVFCENNSEYYDAAKKRFNLVTSQTQMELT